MPLTSIQSKPILVTGATGYVGGRLVSRLLSGGYRVRAVGRSLRKLSGRSWANHADLEFAKVDLENSDLDDLIMALEGCSVAYYLVHSMNPRTKNFALADRRAAKKFLEAAKKSEIERIVYLGGLGNESQGLSPHLKSRLEVGKILKSGPIPVTIFRSCIILGSGSASFEILRYLSERLPVMLLPASIMDTKIQPICIRNVLNYLVACLEKEETVGGTFDIGGPDIITYRNLFKIYAHVTGLRMPIILTPDFISENKFGKTIGFFMAKLVLPISSSVSTPLLQGSRNCSIVEDNQITKIIPQDLMSCEDAIRRAIQKDSLQIVETRWTDAGELKPPEWVHLGDAPYAGGTLLQGGFKVSIAAAPENIWPFIERIGGQHGWYYGDFLWRIRGWMDTMVGGVGLRRGRRNPEVLLVGDALDFWRVLKINPPYRLILLAEMKLPGEAILEFQITQLKPNHSQLRLNTRFRSRGLYGLFYWYLFLPFHDLLFGGMLKAMAREIGRPILRGPVKFRP